MTKFQAMRRRGFSLLEMVVGLGLAGLLMTVMATLWSSTRQLGSHLHERMDLSSRSRMIERWLTTDFSATLPGGVSLGPNGSLVGVQPVIGVDSQGSSTWSSSLVLYSWDAASGVLRRLTVTPPFPMGGISPTALRPAQLSQAAAQPALSTQVLSQQVKEFAMTATPEGVFLVKLALEASVPGSSQPERFQLSQALAAGL